MLPYPTGALPASAAAPQPPPCPFTPSIPVPWDPNRPPWDTQVVCFPPVKSGLGSPPWHWPPTALPHLGSGSQKWVNFPSCLHHLPQGLPCPGSKAQLHKFPLKTTAGWPLTLGPQHGSPLSGHTFEKAPGPWAPIGEQPGVTISWLDSSGKPLNISVPQFLR